MKRTEYWTRVAVVLLLSVLCVTVILRELYLRRQKDPPVKTNSAAELREGLTRLRLSSEEVAVLHAYSFIDHFSREGGVEYSLDIRSLDPRLVSLIDQNKGFDQAVEWRAKQWDQELEKFLRGLPREDPVWADELRRQLEASLKKKEEAYKQHETTFSMLLNELETLHQSSQDVPSENYNRLANETMASVHALCLYELEVHLLKEALSRTQGEDTESSSIIELLRAMPLSSATKEDSS